MSRSQLTPFSRHGSRTILISASVLLLMTLVIGGSGLAAVPPTTNDAGGGSPADLWSSSTARNNASATTHTLRISGTGKYIVTATGTLTISKTESSEVVQPPVVQGAVGEGGDRVDVIRFTGHITSFKYRGELRATLDGHHAPPRVLTAKYLKVSALSNSSINYRFAGADTIIPGGDAERNDYSTTNRSQVDGKISGTDQIDSFYYTGRFDTGWASSNLTVHVNGQQIPVYEKGSRSTSSTSTPSSPSSPSSPVSSPTSATASPDTQLSEPSTTDASNHSPVSGRLVSSPASPSVPRDGGGGLSMVALVAGIGVMILVAIGGIVLLAR